jgi:hypothetical protein
VKSTSICICLLPGCLLFAAMGHGAEYYLDPATGNSTNPGTRAAPWGSLEAVAAERKTFAAGDVLVLLAGHHGSPVVRGSNPGPVTIRPAAGARATLTRLTIQDGRFWTVEGLEISPEIAANSERRGLVTVLGGSDNVIRGCLIYTASDISRWTAADWNSRACNGVTLEGTRQLLENCRLQNLRFAMGIPPGATHNTVRGNLIMNFCGDGIRASGDFTVIEGNIVKNLYKVNKNHPDAFQSWSQTSAGVGRGVVRGVILRGNYFLSYDDPRQPFRSALQGIGCFDGFFEDWVVENNVIITTAWHGIAFYGALNCRIVNNTVADLDPTDKGVPWIKITAHKNKKPSSGNLVRNNLSGRLAIDPGAAQVDHNLSKPDARWFFPGWASGDLRLAERSDGIDAGTHDGAPAVDLRGAPRSYPGNAACDLGAYEFGALDNEKPDPASRPWEPRLQVPPMPDPAPVPEQYLSRPKI